MTQTKAPGRFSRIAAIAVGVAALSLALPFSALADGKNHGSRHGKHARHHYSHGENYGYYGPPPVYYRAGPPPCRGPRKVKAYGYYRAPVYYVPARPIVRVAPVRVNVVFGF
jgi:hypothetical protein